MAPLFDAGSVESADPSAKFYRWFFPLLEEAAKPFTGVVQKLESSPGPRFGLKATVYVDLNYELGPPLNRVLPSARIRVTVEAHGMDSPLQGGLTVDGARCRTRGEVLEALTEALTVAEAGLRLGAGT